MMEEIYISMNTEPLISKRNDVLSLDTSPIIRETGLDEEELIISLLNLSNPLIDENVEYFLEFGGIHLLTSKIHSSTNLEFPKSFVSIHEIEERRQSHLGDRVIALMTNPSNLDWVYKKRFEIIRDLFNVYSVGSNVSTTCFKILYLYIIQKWDDVLDWVLLDTSNQEFSSWIWLLLKYVEDSNTLDCIMVTIFRYVSNESRELRQDRFMKFVEMEWMDQLFELLIKKNYGILMENLKI